MADLELTTKIDEKGAISKASAQMRQLRENAQAADKTIATTARATAPQLSGALGGVATRAQGLLANFNSVAGAIGLAVSAAGALRLIVSELDEKSARIKKGFTGIFGDIGAETRLKGLESIGLAPEGIIKKLEDLQKSMAVRGLNRTTGEYMQAGAEISAVAGMRGQDPVEAVRMAMELWARGGFQGSFADSAANMSRVLQTGQTRMLAQYGIAIDDSRFEGMEPEERTKAVFEAMQKQLSGESYIAKMLSSRDPRAAALLAQISAEAAKETTMQAQATAVLPQKLAYENFRRAMEEQGIDPKAFAFGGGGIGQPMFWAAGKELDPESTIIGAFFRLITRIGQAAGLDMRNDLAVQYTRDANKQLNIQTNPAQTSR